MGIETVASTVIGVAIYRNDLKAITKSKPEYTQTEDRWDPLTGEKVKSVVVKHRGYEYCSVDGTDYTLDDPSYSWELAEKLAEIVGAPTAFVTVDDAFESALIGVVVCGCDGYGYFRGFDGPSVIQLQTVFDDAAKWKEKLEKLLGVALSWGLFTHVHVVD